MIAYFNVRRKTRNLVVGSVVWPHEFRIQMKQSIGLTIVLLCFMHQSDVLVIIILNFFVLLSFTFSFGY